MSDTGTDLTFKYVQGRLMLRADDLLLWLWERYSVNREAGHAREAAEVREILSEIMQARP